jgi:glucose-6-phosphate isomerase
MKSFDPGIDVIPVQETMMFQYGAGVVGPKPEHRKLDAIRESLREPQCEGPDIVYSIVMDVSKAEHRAELEARMLLYGIVTYASGRLGQEPIRSQGHIHRISTHSGWSPPELYEIWSGTAYIYMQEKANDNPGRCFAVIAEPGDVVVVPPGWAHATISADPSEALTFGAWCDREYGFEYEDVRKHQGLAWYPLFNDEGQLEWKHNEHYNEAKLTIKKPEPYLWLGIEPGIPIYKQFEQDPGRFQWVSQPSLKAEQWKSFTP